MFFILTRNGVHFLVAEGRRCEQTVRDGQRAGASLLPQPAAEFFGGEECPAQQHALHQQAAPGPVPPVYTCAGEGRDA